MKVVREVIISGIIMLILDAIFIGLNQKTYFDLIANVQRVVLQLRISGAIICYFFLIVGLNYFIISKRRSIPEAFLFGLVVYGVYDSTNYATLKRWSAQVAIMDTIWGGILMATTTHFTYMLSNL
jgi:uncharacterized membrane protein